MSGKHDESGCGSKGCPSGPQQSEREKKASEQDAMLKDRLTKIRHKIMVLSGKGGVGKSTVAANIAVALAMEGKQVGLLDIDFHGPSIPTLLNLEGKRIGHDGESIIPIEFAQNLKVMSLGFLLNEPDEAVIWRGPLKMGVLKQLLAEVKWGELDYLIMDFPPGTGDEPLSAAQLIPDSDGAIIVTTPQNLSTIDVRKSINFCRKVGVPVIGVIENMSGFVCPKCHEVVDIFKTGGGKTMAEEMGVPFLGKIPIDPAVVQASDDGKPFMYTHSTSEAAKAFSGVVGAIMESEAQKASLVKDQADRASAGGNLKIAIPVSDGRLSSHFGHCEIFALFDVDTETKTITNRQDLQAPPHEPGVLPAWLGEKGANMIIAGGMGTRAQDLFTSRGIQVIVGAPQDTPEQVIGSYLSGALQTGDNLCDH
ncbi:MAG: iron-sulfur cluster carrier protein MrpORP [Desulfomonilia bacterium]